MVQHGKVYPEIFFILSCQFLRHEPWASFTTLYLYTAPLSRLTSHLSLTSLSLLSPLSLSHHSHPLTLTLTLSLHTYFPRFTFHVSFPSRHALCAIPAGFCLRLFSFNPPASPAATDMPPLTELVFLRYGSGDVIRLTLHALILPIRRLHRRLPICRS